MGCGIPVCDGLAASTTERQTPDDNHDEHDNGNKLDKWEEDENIRWLELAKNADIWHALEESFAKDRKNRSRPSCTE